MKKIPKETDEKWDKKDLDSNVYQIEDDRIFMTRFFIYAFYSVLSFLFFIPFLSIGAQVDPSDPTLSQEERTKIIERQEDRWQISKSSSNF